MMKKIFGMAAVSALAFSMFACSGEDGADGINGKDGADGADGIGCVVKSLKDGSGYKVLCDGDSVGVLKNGADGKDGKKGADGEDGEDGADGKDAKSVTGKNGADGKAGTSCTVKENKAKTGFDIVCGTETVGTVLKGTDGADDEGEDGESCTLKEGENGTVTVECDGESVTLYKASCGKVGYDPATQFCYSETGSNPRVAVRCKYSVGDDKDHFMDRYNPSTYFCDETDTLRNLCTVINDDGKEVRVPYMTTMQYCDNAQKKLVDLIPCAPGSKVKRKESEYCYTTKDAEGIQVAAMPNCGTTANGTVQFNPRVNFCKVKTGGYSLGKREICGDATAQKDTLNMDIRYNVSVAGNGTVSLDREDNGYICDSRDYQIYRFVKIGSKYWMAQNLNYAYTLPTAAGEKSLDSSSTCFDNDPANCEIYGRMYTWSAAIDSVNLKDSEGSPWLCGDGVSCQFAEDEFVKGVCPTGWHLPKDADVKQLIVDADGSITAYDDLNVAGLKLRAESWEGGSDDYGFSAIGGGYASLSDDGKMIYDDLTSAFYMWTDTQKTKDNAYALYLYYDEDEASIYNDRKYYLEAVRCIKD